MIELIVNWAAGIVFVTLFATFLELLLPTSNMQTFVRVIMGLLIMLAILNPVMGFFERSLNSGEIAALAPRVTAASTLQDGTMAAMQNRNRLIKDVYRRDLAKQMQSLVMGIEGVASASIHIDFSEEQTEPLKIKTVTVMVQPGAAKEKVARVVIGERTEVLSLPPEIVRKVRQRLGELYQLQTGQIIVKPMQG